MAGLCPTTKTEGGPTRGAIVPNGDKATLRRVPILSGLADTGLDRVMAFSTTWSVESGTVLFQEGEPADRFFVVLEGWVKVYRMAADGTETVIMMFTCGESVAQAAIFDDLGYPASGEAVGQTRLMVIPSAPFLGAVSSDERFARSVLSGMSRRLRDLVSEIEQAKCRSSCHRVAEFILRICPVDEGGAFIRLPFNKGSLASRLGMTQATLSRGLARLRDVGVTTSGREIAILDVTALRRFCDASARSWTMSLEGARHGRDATSMRQLPRAS